MRQRIRRTDTDIRVGVEVLGVCGKARDPERGTEIQTHWDRDKRSLRLREEQRREQKDPSRWGET